MIEKYVTYKIAKSDDKFSEDFTFGIFDDTLPKDLRNRINASLIELGMPWKECIPYYKDSFHVFTDFSALQFFCTYMCKFTIEDIQALKDAGYELYKFDSDSVSRGLSTYRATIYSDELNNVTTLNMHKLIDINCDKPVRYKMNTADVRYCKEKHYSDINYVK